jgi:CDP-diacylglycerol--glycerol-3-phosphate 3-phosphatidyltransferase
MRGFIGYLKRQQRSVVANTITLSRVVLTCIVNYYLLFHFGKVELPLLIFGLVFLTDYLDGKIARLSKTVSPGGAVFDFLADCFFIFLTCLVLHYFRIFPPWFIFVVVGKGLEFVLTSFILKQSSDGNKVFFFDYLGRFVAVIFYVYPVLLYVSHCFSPIMYDLCLNRLTYLILFLTLLSSSYRIKKCFRSVTWVF